MKRINFETAKQIGIYKILNLANNKMYVGKSIELENRWVQHKSRLNNNKHFNQHLQAAWNKYGEINFVFIILENCVEELLDKQETYWINILDAKNREIGYNLKDGGIGGTLSNESKLKISKALKGRKRSFEEIENIKKGFKHLPLSDEIKQNRSRISKDLYYNGKFKNTKIIYQYDLNGNFIKQWQSITEAANNFKISASNISACANNNYKQSAGYFWSYTPMTDFIEYNGRTHNRKKKIISINIKDVIVVYDSIEAASKLGFGKSSIIRCCKNKQTFHKNLKWMYYEDALEEGLVQSLKIIINANNTSSSNSNKV
jgi:group I intron endonuclease